MSVQFWEKHPARWHFGIIGVLAVLIGVLMGLVVGKFQNPILLTGIAAGFVIALLSISNIEFGLLVFIVITYIRLSDVVVHEYSMPSIAQPFIALLALAILLRWAVSGELPKGWIKPTILVLAYGLVIFGSMFYALDYTQAQSAADDYWKDGLITILVAALVQNKKTFRHVIWALLVAGIFMSSLSVYQYLTGTFNNSYFGFAVAPQLNIVGTTSGNRVAGPIGDPNFYAQILVVLIPLAINRTVNEKSLFLKAVAGYATFAISLSLILTFSRGGFFALVAALAALALYQPPKVSVVATILACAVGLTLLMPSTFLERISTIPDVLAGTQDIRNEASLSGRASEAISAWMMFKDHPILGVGAHNYPVYYQTYSRQLGLDSRTEMREPHNLFLEVAAEGGIIGLLIFVAVIYSAFKAINSAWAGFGALGDKDFQGLVGAFSAGLIGYLAAAMFIHGAFPRYFWLLIGIALALTNVLRSEIAKANEI